MVFSALICRENLSPQRIEKLNNYIVLLSAKNTRVGDAIVHIYRLYNTAGIYNISLRLSRRLRSDNPGINRLYIYIYIDRVNRLVRVINVWISK